MDPKGVFDHIYRHWAEQMQETRRMSHPSDEIAKYESLLKYSTFSIQTNGRIFRKTERTI